MCIYTYPLFPLFRAKSLSRRSRVGRRALIKRGETISKDRQQRKVGQKDDPLAAGLVWSKGGNGGEARAHYGGHDQYGRHARSPKMKRAAHEVAEESEVAQATLEVTKRP